jgi:hypothetical protein
MFSQIILQGRKLGLFFFLLYFVPLLFLAAIYVISLQLNVDMGLFFRDPVSIAGLPSVAGIVSSIGVMFWTISATLCLFSWGVLRGRLSQASFSTFLLCAGLMTTILLFDDLFLFHENLYPKYFGISEKYIYLGYASLIVCGMVKFRNNILDTDYVILLSCLTFFASSLLVDQFQQQIQDVIGGTRILLEDGFKLLGIVGWFGYFLRCSTVAIREKIEEPIRSVE